MTIACSNFKLHHFHCVQAKWSVLLVCTIHRADRQRHVALTWEVFVLLETRRGGVRQCSFSNAFWPCVGALDSRSKERFLCSYIHTAPFCQFWRYLNPAIVPNMGFLPIPTTKLTLPNMRPLGMYTTHHASASPILKVFPNNFFSTVLL